VLSDAQQLVIDQQHEIEQAKARIAKLRLKSTLHGGPGQADKVCLPLSESRVLAIRGGLSEGSRSER
jgi:hypothetical protein